MKRIPAILFVAAFAATAVLGCKGTPGPKASFEAWLQAIEKCESARIKSGLTKESVAAIEQMTTQLKAFLPPDKAKEFDFFGDQLCKGFKPDAVTIKGEEVDGESARILVSAEGKDEKIPMKKQDGAWKIDFTALMGGAKPSSPPPPPAPPKPAKVEPPAGTPAPEAPTPEAAAPAVKAEVKPVAKPVEKPTEAPAKTE